ncbi:MAG TPA: HepT-like ribonuclease domain-containing protein [Hyphomonadaceae bacterium]|nr:HepT-like ribonuclease domain-containing protein [Hyphomonadaceae bacterium]
MGKRAITLTAGDTEVTYLANEERQYAIERLLIRFGEALKDVPPEILAAIDPAADWSGPKAFRDLASHWYEDGLDHALIWRAVRLDLPGLVQSIERWLNERPHGS